MDLLLKYKLMITAVVFLFSCETKTGNRDENNDEDSSDTSNIGNTENFDKNKDDFSDTAVYQEFDYSDSLIAIKKNLTDTLYHVDSLKIKKKIQLKTSRVKRQKPYNILIKINSNLADADYFFKTPMMTDRHILQDIGLFSV